VRPANPERVLGLIGRRVAELRAERDLTQEQLAERAEVSARYVQRVEAGTENLTVRTLIKVSNALRVPLADLLVTPVAPRAQPGRPRRAHT
jgi:transcriptional regulator with XRE-family HTH domain